MHCVANNKDATTDGMPHRFYNWYTHVTRYLSDATHAQVHRIYSIKTWTQASGMV
jgi:hypothetical protein